MRRLADLRSLLIKAKKNRTFIRFRRRFEKSSGFFRGYVIAVGREFFLLSLVGDTVRYDGFAFFRIKDISKMDRDPSSTFAETALRKRKQRSPRATGLRTGNIREMLVSAGRAFPLVTIHREEIDPNVCWIGRILVVGQQNLSILEISPAAIWETNPSSYRLKEITRVDFGGGYEDALYLVAGDPPNRARAKFE